MGYPARMPAPLLAGTWSFARWCNDAAWPALAAGGSALDAAVGAVEVAELDQRVDSVGVGGIPDAAGRVTLDAAVMLSPQRWGSVLCLSEHARAAAIARRVMERFGRGIRAGHGADAFAAAEGFERVGADGLLTDRVREWLQKRRAEDATAGRSQRPTDVPSLGVGILDTADGRLHLSAEEVRWGPLHPGHDTVGVVALDRAGTLAACTSTSGMPLKPIGRIGDSAIPGHGLACEPGVGAVVATGAGELISSVSLSFLALEVLRKGGTARDAVRDCLARLDAATHPGTLPQAALIVVTPSGIVATGALRPGYATAITRDGRTGLEAPDLIAHPR